MELVKLTADRPAIVLGEAMIEVSDIKNGRCRLGVAGDTFNTAVYMARAGVPVAYATCIGDDPFSDRILTALREEDIGAGLVARRAGAAPGLYAVSLDHDGERSFTYWRSQSAARRYFETSGPAALSATLAAPALFYFSGITLSIFTPDEHQRIAALAVAVRDHGGVVAFDTNYREKGWESGAAARRAIAAVSPYISIALPTHKDDATLFGDRSPEETLQRWLDSGAREVAVKDGANGALLSGDGSVSGGVWSPPEEAVTPLDTTGVGDAFNGAYLAARLTGASQAMAAQAAHRVAGQVLQTPGAILERR